MVRTEREMRLAGDGGWSGRRQAAWSLPLEDELEREEGSIERRSDTDSDLALVLSTDDGDAGATAIGIGPARGRNEMHTGLIHVDNK